MKYKLIKNAYLTVIAAPYYNSHFSKGTEFECAANRTNYVILKGKDISLYVSKDRLKECFEKVWENTNLFDSEF